MADFDVQLGVTYFGNGFTPGADYTLHCDFTPADGSVGTHTGHSAVRARSTGLLLFPAETLDDLTMSRVDRHGTYVFTVKDAAGNVVATDTVEVD